VSKPVARKKMRKSLARRPHPQGREAGRSPHRASEELRAGDQSQDRQGAQHHDSLVLTAPGGPCRSM